MPSVTSFLVLVLSLLEFRRKSRYNRFEVQIRDERHSSPVSSSGDDRGARWAPRLRMGHHGSPAPVQDRFDLPVGDGVSPASRTEGHHT